LARPRKEGLDYFNLDTDRYQDIKIKRLKKNFKCTGIAVYDYILCEIYRVRGCFLEWDENTTFDVAEYFGLKESTVSEIVNYCCVVGLFDRGLLTSERILTSKAIQERYFKICTDAKRKTDIPMRYLCVNSEETPVNSEESTQRKVKKNKEKESKESPPTPLWGSEGECEDFSDLPESLQASLETYFAVRAQSGVPIKAIQQGLMVAKLLSATGSDFAKAEQWVKTAATKNWKDFYEPFPDKPKGQSGKSKDRNEGCAPLVLLPRHKSWNPEDT